MVRPTRPAPVTLHVLGLNLTFEAEDFPAALAKLKHTLGPIARGPWRLPERDQKPDPAPNYSSVFDS